MKPRARIHILVLLTVALVAGTARGQQRPPAPVAPVTAAPTAGGDIAAILSQTEQAGRATVADLGKLRVDKWKTDSATKQSAQQNAQALARNINAALPGMIQQVRTSPTSVAAEFKLYRNLNALYDVLSGLTESAGAFGSKSDYQALADELNAFDQVRLALADRLQTLTAEQDTEITRLRSVEAAAARAAAAPATPPKKIVIDDTASTKATKKKTAKKKTTTNAASPSKPAPQTPQ